LAVGVRAWNSVTAGHPSTPWPGIFTVRQYSDDERACGSSVVHTAFKLSHASAMLYRAAYTAVYVCDFD